MDFEPPPRPTRRRRTVRRSKKRRRGRKKGFSRMAQMAAKLSVFKPDLINATEDQENLASLGATFTQEEALSFAAELKGLQETGNKD